jgi:hypothetical protein
LNKVFYIGVVVVVLELYGFFYVFLEIFGFVLVDATGCAEWTVAASAAATSTLQQPS